MTLCCHAYSWPARSSRVREVEAQPFSSLVFPADRRHERLRRDRESRIVVQPTDIRPSSGSRTTFQRSSMRRSCVVPFGIAHFFACLRLLKP